ncbi:hypothetical protein PILCRDRAFT_337324 [Piloderma croceum F 1598]|uniref:Uncharacterized protein n=1 Tax=Piloderma croceum (strain F 1598) TaxID=765440 RepID=A0A0C3G096_PILCF|nr:hypothetical protein PILCRDRAFT_337324 [Piloderma croceum F 1598]
MRSSNRLRCKQFHPYVWDGEASLDPNHRIFICRLASAAIIGHAADVVITKLCEIAKRRRSPCETVNVDMKLYAK